MTDRLDVLIVSQPAAYGVAVFVRDLTEAAVAAGHRVTVVSPGEAHGPLAGWVAASGARHRRLDLARSPSPRDAIDLVTLRRLMRGRDVVHLHSSKAAALGRVAAATIRRDRRPAVIVTAHYWSWLVGGPWASVYRWIERMLADRCDALVAVSD
ncbi:MAG TPA: glycosyltransferase family 4 protein, partial [Actinomycetota bacterium]|nr:glycosyltransferase family 4 protein [Actinomycetota bacterium]